MAWAHQQQRILYKQGDVQQLNYSDQTMMRRIRDKNNLTGKKVKVKRKGGQIGRAHV